jgi:ATP-dependent DNA helicase 2 subunit 1
MKNKIITSESDRVGIVLFGCSSSINPLNFKNITVL